MHPEWMPDATPAAAHPPTAARSCAHDAPPGQPRAVVTSDSPTAAAPRWKLTLLAVAVTVTLVLAGCPGTNPTLVVPAIRKHTDRGGGDRSGQTGEFSGDDPATRWTLSSDAAAVNPIPVGGTGAIVSLGTHLVRVTGSTGEEAWRVDVGNLSGSPALDGAGNVIFATTEGVVRAIDSETSRDIWQVDLEGMARTAPLPLSSTIVVGVERDLVALDPASGTTVWRTTLPARLSGSPAADEDDLVLALDDDGVLHGLDGPTGTRLFDVHLATDARRTDEDASGQPITPAVVGDLGLVVAPDGRVSGVSIPDGTVMWTTDPGGLSARRRPPTRTTSGS